LRIAIFALSAAVLGLASAGSASAFTPAAMNGLSAQKAGISLIDYKPGYKKYKGNRPFKYRPGGHYRHAPGNWHRYDKRPGDWHTRGCIVVGPIWWCP